MFKIGQKVMYDKLTSNGYKRVSPNGSDLRKWINVSRYDLFVKGDYDALTEYYSLFFKPL